MHRLSRAASLALCLLFLPALGFGQNTFLESEPNNRKEQATPAADVQSGDRLIAGEPNCPPQRGDADLFRVRTAPLPPGVYRHELNYFNGNFGKARPRILGKDVWDGQVIPGSYSIVQQASGATPAERSLAWYGFGKSEELYVDLDNPHTCRATYSMELNTTPVTPTDIGTLPLGFTPISTFSPTGEIVDTAVQLFDAEFEPLTGQASDDRPGDPDGAPDMAPPLSAGRYYLAVAFGELVSSQPPGIRRNVPEIFGVVSEEARLFGGVLDFKGALVGGLREPSPTATLVVGSSSYPLLQTRPFEVLWFQFDVGTTQASTSFCRASDVGLNCPLPWAVGSDGDAGCPNSTGRGADLVIQRYSFLPSWSFVVHDLPPNALTRISVAMSSGPPVQLRAGFGCLTGNVLSLAPQVADGNGFVQIIEQELAPLGFPSGSTLYAQALYVDSAAPPGDQFNASSAVSLMIP